MKVGINGMGIAGPALAYWLRRFGHEPVMFERASKLRTGGYLIDFWGVGYALAEKMGIIEPVLQRGYAPSAGAEHEPDGRCPRRLRTFAHGSGRRGDGCSRASPAEAGFRTAGCPQARRTHGKAIVGMRMRAAIVLRYSPATSFVIDAPSSASDGQRRSLRGSRPRGPDGQAGP